MSLKVLSLIFFGTFIANAFVKSQNDIGFESNEISDIYRQKAEQELGETPENVEFSLKNLRELFANEKSLKIPLDDDNFFLKFLRPMKFDIEKTFNRIKYYYEFKDKHQDLTNVLPSAVKDVFDSEIVQVLPQRDGHGRRVFILNIGRWDTSKQSMEDLFRAIQLAINFVYQEPLTQINGAVGIINYDGLSFSHTHSIPISLVPVIMDWSQNVMPARIGGIGVYVVNNSYLFDIIFQLIEPLLQGELKQNLHIENSNFENVVNAVGADVLEKRFGGKLENDIPYGKNFYKLLESHLPEIQKLNSYGYTNATSC